MCLENQQQVWLPIRQVHNTIPSSQTGRPLSPSQTQPLGTRSCLWAKRSDMANKEGKEWCFVPPLETSGHLMGRNQVHFKRTPAPEGRCLAVCVGTFIMWKHEESGIHQHHDLILDFYYKWGAGSPILKRLKVNDNTAKLLGANAVKPPPHAYLKRN